MTVKLESASYTALSRIGSAQAQRQGRGRRGRRARGEPLGDGHPRPGRSVPVRRHGARLRPATPAPLPVRATGSAGGDVPQGGRGSQRRGGPQRADAEPRRRRSRQRHRRALRPSVPRILGDVVLGRAGQAPARAPRTQLRQRGLVEGRKVLDAGCGGGRYSVAWRLLGARARDRARRVEDRAGRRARAGQDRGHRRRGVRAGQCCACRSPTTCSMSCFSNGVLHHTQDWREGLFEWCGCCAPAAPAGST